MIVARDLPEAVGNTPLIRLRRASEATGCEIWGKAEFMNPGAVGQGPRRALDHPRRGGARRAAARRHHRRGHRRQHRHRPGADRRGDGLPHGHRHPRHPEPGEEGRDPRRRAPSWSRCRRCPTATRTTTCATPAGWPRRWPRPSRTARSGPTSSTTSPTARRTSRAPRPRSGSRPAAGSTASSARSARAARWPASPTGCARASPAVKIGLADPDGAALYNYYAHGELKAEGISITEGIGQGRITANLEGLTVDMPYRIPDAEALPLVFDLLEHEGLCMGASTGDQRRRRDPHGARPRARATPSSPSSATTAPATSRSSSTRRSCARRACRCRTGSRRGRDLPDAFVRLSAGRGRRPPARGRAAAARRAGGGGAGADRGRGRRRARQALGRGGDARRARWSTTRDLDRGARGAARASWSRSAARRSRPSRSASRRSTSSTSGSQALGPPPAEGAEEAPEIAALRRDLTEQIAEAQAPVLAAQEAYRRTDALIGAIDRTVRARFSAELMSRGPSPLRPATWLAALEELGGRAARLSRRGCATEFAEPGHARAGAAPAADQPPADRRRPRGSPSWCARWLVDWVERRLADDAERGASAALLVALRNLTRLVVPAVGAGLFFAAFDPRRPVRPRRRRAVLRAAALRAGPDRRGLARRQPARAEAPRVPADAARRRRGARGAIGWCSTSAVVLSLAYLRRGADRALVVLARDAVGAAVPAGGARRARPLAGRRPDRRGARLTSPRAPTRRPDAIVGLRLLRLIARVLRVIAVVAPLLGAAGYMPAAGFLVFRSILTLGLLGRRVRRLRPPEQDRRSRLLASPTAPPRQDDGGLIPVVVGALVGRRLRCRCWR